DVQLPRILLDELLVPVPIGVPVGEDQYIKQQLRLPGGEPLDERGGQPLVGEQLPHRPAEGPGKMPLSDDRVVVAGAVLGLADAMPRRDESVDEVADAGDVVRVGRLRLAEPYAVVRPWARDRRWLCCALGGAAFGLELHLRAP